MIIQRGRILLFPQDGKKVGGKRAEKEHLDGPADTCGVAFINIKRYIIGKPRHQLGDV